MFSYCREYYLSHSILFSMHKKEEVLQFINGIIADIEARPNRSDQENDELELWKIHREEIIAADSDEALFELINFMKKTMAELGFSYKF